MAGSPQSTLCGCKMSSSRGSPNCPSPPATAALNRNEASWDLLYAAAGEVARMRMVEEAASRYYNQNKNYMAQQAPRRTSSPNLNYQQLQVAQVSIQYPFYFVLIVIFPFLLNSDGFCSFM